MNILVKRLGFFNCSKYITDTSCQKFLIKLQTWKIDKWKIINRNHYFPYDKNYIKINMCDNLSSQLKQIIVETLNMEEISVEDIQDDTPLIDSGLGMDSIDALELVVRVEKEFNVKIKSSEEAKLALSSVRSLMDFINKHTPD